MSKPNSPTPVIAIIVAIVLATAALIGTEAWNRSHRGHAPTAASVSAGSDAQAKPAAASDGAKPSSSGTSFSEDIPE